MQYKKSQFSHGEGLPRRTFYNYRQAILEVFGIEIKYDVATFEYYIDDIETSAGASIHKWLLNSASTNLVLGDAGKIAHRIILEDIPSARSFLATVMEAIKENHAIEFDYAPYTRVNISQGVYLEPYFLNLFRQRWYVTGRTVDNNIRTYALDRMISVKTLSTVFSIPHDFNAQEYARHAFGVIFTQSPIHDVTLRVEPRQAKYMRTLPLHHSQSEEHYDGFSIFHYSLRLTPDLISEILSMGSTVTVLAPQQLRAMIIEELNRTIKNYEDS